MTTCGASMACGSVTVALAVYVPRARLAVFKVNGNGTHGPGFVIVTQVRRSATDTVSQVTDGETETLSESVPSPMLNASNVCGAAVPPTATCTNTTLFVKRSMGAANAELEKSITKKAKPRVSCALTLQRPGGPHFHYSRR